MHARRLKTRKLGREVGPRKALIRSLATSLILYERMRTTKAKAKETQKVVEKLITLAKDGSVPAIRKLDGFFLDKNASKKLIVELTPLYKERNGGYTRVLNLGPRTGDAAPMALIELLDIEKLTKPEVKEEKKETKSKKEAPEQEKTKKAETKKVESKTEKKSK